jgi:hypothetical protein
MSTAVLQEWTAKDGAAAQQLVAKLQDIAQQHGHALSHAEAISSTVIAEITTPAKGKPCTPPVESATVLAACYCGKGQYFDTRHD